MLLKDVLGKDGGMLHRGLRPKSLESLDRYNWLEQFRLPCLIVMVAAFVVFLAVRAFAVTPSVRTPKRAWQC